MNSALLLAGWHISPGPIESCPKTPNWYSGSKKLAASLGRVGVGHGAMGFGGRAARMAGWLLREHETMVTETSQT